MKSCRNIHISVSKVLNHGGVARDVATTPEEMKTIPGHSPAAVVKPDAASRRTVDLARAPVQTGTAKTVKALAALTMKSESLEGKRGGSII